MAPAARRQRAVTSLARNPKEEGPKKLTAARRVAVMAVGETGRQRPREKYIPRAIVGGALKVRR